MGVPKYTEEFKAEAVRQVTDRNQPVLDVAKRLGMSDVTLHSWIKKSGKSIGAVKQAQSLEAANAEIKRLKAENRTLQEERDILKKAAAYFAEESR